MTETNVQSAMALLPRTLEGTYDRMLRGISEMPELERSLAATALRWLVVARTTLTLCHLVQVCNVFRKTAMHVQPAALVDVLTDLVSIEGDPDHDETLIRLGHYSVQEYLICGRIAADVAHFGFEEKNAHTTVTQSCCAAFLDEVNEFPSGRSLTRESHPLIAYATNYWDDHSLLRMEHADGIEVQFLLSTLARSRLLAASERFGVAPMSLEGYGRSFENWTEPSALYIAAVLGMDRIVQSLCETGADVNARSGVSGTAAAAACLAGHKSTFELLLSNGANWDTRTCSGQHVIVEAVSEGPGKRKAVEMLLEQGASPNTMSIEGRTCLTIAVAKKNPPMIRLLLSVGANPDLADRRGWAALHYLAGQSHNDLAIAKMLASHGANLSLETSFGHTAVALLKRFNAPGAHELVQHLVFQGAKNVSAAEGLVSLPTCSTCFKWNLRVFWEVINGHSSSRPDIWCSTCFRGPPPWTKYLPDASQQVTLHHIELVGERFVHRVRIFRTFDEILGPRSRLRSQSCTF